MARQFYGFFDSADEDLREYVADDFAQVLRGFFGDGVKALGENLRVTPGAEGLTTQITSGMAAIQGYMYGLYDDGGGPLQLTHVEADVLPRIDRVALRLDRATATRSIAPVVLRGTPAASPLAPALTRNGIVWEISLARVAIAAGADEIVGGNITDERADDAVCGVIEPHQIKEYVNQGVKTTDTPTFTGINAPHTQAMDTITGLPEELAGKAAVSHTQAISTVTGLQAALEAKAALYHAQKWSIGDDPDAPVDDGCLVVQNTIKQAGNLVLDESAKSGMNEGVISGTAGAGGNLAAWNVDGDLVDAGIAYMGDGTWVPVTAGLTTLGGFSYTTRNGYYLKIGKIVIATFYLVFSGATGSPAGVISVSLPSAASNSTNKYFFAAARATAVNWGASAVSPIWLVGPSNDYARLYGQINNGVFVGSDASSIGNGDVLAGTIIYEEA